MYIKRLKKLALTVVATACWMATGAQEGRVLRLSMEEAQQYAVEHNATMRNADLDVKKAELSRWQTLSSMLPQVRAGFDYQNMCGYEMHMGSGPMSISIPMDPNGTLSLTASVALTGAQVVGPGHFGRGRGPRGEGGVVRRRSDSPASLSFPVARSCIALWLAWLSAMRFHRCQANSG